MTQMQTVGEYFQIISALGSGGFGETFLAEDLRRADRPRCVVKQLKPQSTDAEVIKLSKRLFEQEVQILYKIGEHPQIPSIITHFEDRNEFYFVQEYIEGNTFAEEIAQGKVFGARKVFEIVTELLNVLAFVHSRGVIHRDIKPENLICRASDGKPVLIDFGAVKQVSGQTALNPHQPTRGTIAIGSEGYMPPEQLSGHPRFSSDIYAVGMFAVQLLTQTHPSKLRQNQRTGEWIWQDKAHVNNQLAEFINRMIRYDFRQRFTDAVEALNYLQKLQSGNHENHNISQPKIDNRQTQATFFSPAGIQQNNEVNSIPQTYLPQNNLPNYQPINPAPTQYVYPHPINNTLKPTERESSVFNMVSLGDFTDSSAFKPMIYAFAVISVFAVITVILKFAIQFNAQIPEPQTNSPMLAARSYGPVNTPRTSPTIKQIETKGFMSSAQRKEQNAKTFNDWYSVAQEWQKAEEYYTKTKSVAVSDEDREMARKDKEFCEQRKQYALSKSEPKKKNKL